MTAPGTSPSRPRRPSRLPGSGSAGQVAALLRASGPMTRGELGTTMGLSRTTVSATVTRLIEDGWVDERPSTTTFTGRGRPPTLLALTQQAGIAIGVDLGRSHARVVLAHLGHEVLAEQALELHESWHATAAVEAVEKLVDDVVAAAGVDRAGIVGIGLGLPAPLDTSGHSASITIPPDWMREDPARALSQRLGVPVVVDNDANLGALAEARWGAGRRSDTLFYVKASTGIGAGLVLGGRLFRGSAGTAGELGHFTVDEDGLVCRCGSRGCLEVRAGGPALVAEVGHSRSGINNVGDLIAAARGGDLACTRVLADAGETLGVALAAVLNILNPDRVVLGGELGGAGELVLASLRESLARNALSSAVRSSSVVPSQLGRRAEALGAVLLVLTEAERFTTQPGPRAKGARSPLTQGHRSGQQAHGHQP
ncbi:MAG: transcriptional regulator [Frankiales bacterium]|nr:transcriptional regulator [Frankiales bacterium]